MNVVGCPGHSLIWDNVQINETSRHQHSARHNKFNLWSNVIAAINRIFPEYDGEQVKTYFEVYIKKTTNNCVLYFLHSGCISLNNGLIFNSLGPKIGTLDKLTDCGINFFNKQVLKALDLDLDIFMLNSDDRETIDYIAATIISRIIVYYLTHFKSYKDVTEWHIPHKHSHESSQKSKVVRQCTVPVENI